MKYKQLIFAREYRGYSQTELSEKINGLSQSNLSKFEKGFGLLSEEIIGKIIQFLNFPDDFFNRKINTSIENANYRKKATIGKALIQSFENKCKLIGYLVDEFSSTIEWPEFTLCPLNVEEGYTPEYIANYNRKLLKIGRDQPIREIFSILESNGLIIFEIDALEKFDGVSFITDKGFPVIVVNKNFSNDRKRFTLAHEVGHILLHNENNFPISMHRNKEDEANQFASEFLMPVDEIKNSIRNLKMGDLADIKRKWLTSMGSILRKAKDLNCIDDNRYKYFMIEFSRSGWLKKEPIQVFIDNPTLLNNAYNLIKDHLSYSIDDFVKFTALPADIIEEIFITNDTLKLKIVR